MEALLVLRRYKNRILLICILKLSIIDGYHNIITRSLLKIRIQQLVKNFSSKYGPLSPLPTSYKTKHPVPWHILLGVPVFPPSKILYKLDSRSSCMLGTDLVVLPFCYLVLTSSV